MPWGFTDAQWDAAKEEAREALIEVARRRGTIFYGDLSPRIRVIAFEPQAHAFHALLGGVSVEENTNGRGMLSALVVRREDGLPGEGFFTLGDELGRDTTDPLAFWIQECARVHAAWA